MNNIDSEQLRRLIQRADPASSLPPLRGDQIHKTMESIMTQTVTDSTETPAPRRRRKWLAGAMGVVAAGAAAAIVIPLTFGGDTITTINQPRGGGPAAACAVVTPDSIAKAVSAFRGSVTGIADGTVTLTVTDRFTGDISNIVQTVQGISSGVDGEPITFEVGATYLVAINADETIMTCGSSGIDSPELSAIYSQAFTE